MRVSEARKASYFFASFLTSFLFLFSLLSVCQVGPGHDDKVETHFFKSSTDMYSSSICLARSMSAASARMQIDMRGRGTLGSLRFPRLLESCMSILKNALDGSRETFVTLGVVVLQTNLQFDSLHKVAFFLAIGIDEKLFDGASHA